MRGWVVFVVPVVVVVLAIPMILEWVPPNGLYGFRTPYTLSSDEVWYRANRLSGYALAGGGLVWFALALALPLFVSPISLAYRYAFWAGLAALAVSIVVSFWLAYRR